MGNFDAMVEELQKREKADSKYLAAHEQKIFEAGLLNPVLERITQCVEDGVHLHLNGGVGMLSLNVLRNRPDMHVLELQPNQRVCEAIPRACDIYCLRHSMIMHQTYEQKGVDMLRRTYELPNSGFSSPDLSQTPPQIWVIQDHVRSGSVLERILGNQKVDSASLAFPMCTLTDTRETPYTCLPGQTLDDQEIDKRGRGYMTRLTDRALAIASKVVRKGGRLVLARLATLSQTRGNRTITMEIDMGTHTDHWSGDLSQHSATFLEPEGFDGEQAEIVTMIHK